MTGELLWGSLFPQSETKQATGSERWQILKKMAEKRFAKVNENENDRIVNSAIPKNTQKAIQFG